MKPMPESHHICLKCSLCTKCHLRNEVPWAPASAYCLISNHARDSQGRKGVMNGKHIRAEWIAWRDKGLKDDDTEWTKGTVTALKQCCGYEMHGEEEREGVRLSFLLGRFIL